MKKIILNWINEKINQDLFSLIKLEKSDLRKQEKGIAYRIVEELGIIDDKDYNFHIMIYL